MDDPRLRAILEQFETLGLLLVRPVVQRQVLAFLSVVLVAWLIPIPYRYFVRWLERRYDVAAAEAKSEDGASIPWRVRVVRLLRAVEFLLFPVFGLLLGSIVTGYLNNRGMPSGLFVRLMRLVWLLLAYRVIVAVLYALLAPETARKYRRRFVAPVFAVLFFASLTIGLAGAFPLGEVELFQFMGQALSLRSIATAAAILYLTFAFAWIVRDVLSRYVLPRTQADPGVANTIVTVFHYSIIGFGIFIAAGALGFDLTALLVIFGGLSVGIGFGLQELVANFISGVLLIFEQSLRPGDVVEVGGQRGTVTQLGMRATVLRNIDNIELFVPNKTLLTSNVAAYTLTDRNVRRTIRVGVSYKSDPTQVRDILMDVAHRHGLVLDEPKPAVFFVGFGDSSLDFELAVWTNEPMQALAVLSDLHFMIFSEFRKTGVEIPYPQRDVHFPSPTQLRDVLHLAAQESPTDPKVSEATDQSARNGSEGELAGDAPTTQQAADGHADEDGDRKERRGTSETDDPARLP